MMLIQFNIQVMLAGGQNKHDKKVTLNKDRALHYKMLGVRRQVQNSFIGLVFFFFFLRVTVNAEKSL